MLAAFSRISDVAIECCAASFTTLPATGLIVPLGEWVLRRACSDAVTWTEPLTVAVNLLPAQFRDVAHVLSETGLPAERLELEITESLLINNTEERCSASSTGCASGVKIAMDDFGTGYSNFSYLARFAFDKLKSRRSSREAALPDPFAVTAGSWTVPLWRSRHWPWALSVPLPTATRGLGPWVSAALS